MHVFFLLGFYVIENLCFYPASNFWVGGILPSKGRTRSSKLLWEDSLCSTWTVQFSLSFFFRYGIIEDLNRGFFVCSFFFIGLFFFFFFFSFFFFCGGGYILDWPLGVTVESPYHVVILAPSASIVFMGRDQIIF
jgi:hypothetical protein